MYEFDGVGLFGRRVAAAPLEGRALGASAAGVPGGGVVGGGVVVVVVVVARPYGVAALVAALERELWRERQVFGRGLALA